MVSADEPRRPLIERKRMRELGDRRTVREKCVEVRYEARDDVIGLTRRSAQTLYPCERAGLYGTCQAGGTFGTRERRLDDRGRGDPAPGS